MADFERTERELEVEGKRISLLQESLQGTLHLCNEMVKQLDQFELRVSRLEPIIMPLHRNLSVISRVNQSKSETRNREWTDFGQMLR